MRKISTEDVFKCARLIKDANLKEDIKKAMANGKKEGADVEEIGMDIVFSILDACANVKIEEKFYDLLSGICEKKSDEIKKQSLEATIAEVKKIAEENNLLNFFKSALRLSSKD